MKLSDEKKSMRLRIAETAIELFREKGYDSVTINLICEKAEVAKSSFYYHYKEKSDIIKDYYATINNNVDSIIPTLLKNLNPIEQLWDIMQTYFNHVVENGCELAKTLYAINLKSDKKSFSFEYAHSKQVYISLLQKARSAGLIESPVMDDATLIKIFLNTTTGITYLWCVEGATFDLIQECREAFEAILGCSLLNEGK